MPVTCQWIVRVSGLTSKTVPVDVTGGEPVSKHISPTTGCETTRISDPSTLHVPVQQSLS